MSFGLGTKWPTWRRSKNRSAKPNRFSTRLMLELRNISRCGRTLPVNVLAERKGENLLKNGNLETCSNKKWMPLFYSDSQSYGKKLEEFQMLHTWRITFLGLEFPQSWKRQGVDIDSGSNNGSSSTSSSTSASSSSVVPQMKNWGRRKLSPNGEESIGANPYLMLRHQWVIHFTGLAIAWLYRIHRRIPQTWAFLVTLTSAKATAF